MLNSSAFGFEKENGYEMWTIKFRGRAMVRTGGPHSIYILLYDPKIDAYLCLLLRNSSLRSISLEYLLTYLCSTVELAVETGPS